jgi:DNA polymerase IIIc chi subunit
MLEEKAENEAIKLETELQIAVNSDIQKLIGHYMEKTNFDPISITSMIKLVVDHYLEQMKEQWKKYCEDQETYTTEIKEDIENLIKEVE